MLERLRRKILLSIGLGAVVFLALSLYVDLDRLVDAFEQFEWRYLFVALFLAAINYLIRYVRWHAYMGQLGVPLAGRESLVIFLAGLILSVTPGKAGELVKAVMVNVRTGTPVSRAASAVFAERLTDFISLIFLAFVGIFTSRQDPFLLASSLVVLLGFTALLGIPRAVFGVLDIVGRVPVLRRLHGPARTAYEGARCLLSAKNLCRGVGLAVVAWFAECLGLYYVLVGFGSDVGVVQATFVYSFATVVGALTMLPGGVGPTEGSMSGLLVLRDVALPVAVGATFVIRVCTLWFAVGVGAVAMFVSQRQMADVNGSSEPTGDQDVQGSEKTHQDA